MQNSAKEEINCYRPDKNTSWQTSRSSESTEEGVLRRRHLLPYCEDSCPLLDCRLMPSRRTGTRSACVEAAEDLSQRFASITWPENVYARPWTFNDRQTSKSKTIDEHEDPPRSMNVLTRQVDAEVLQSSSSDSTNMNSLQ